MSFNPQNANFELVFRSNTDVQQPTLIYLNEEWWYPNGYTVDITPAIAVTWTSPETNRISVSFTEAAENGSVIQINITPA
jgi:endoglycosylceramidase